MIREIGQVGASVERHKNLVKPPRLSITPAILKGVWERESITRDKAMWAAASLCFLGYLCSGEVCILGEKAFDNGARLMIKIVRVESLANPQSVQIKIKASKTNPFHQGVLVCVGRTNKPLCQVSALLHTYMVMRANKPGPLFIFQDGKPLTRPCFVAEVRRALLSAGIDPKHYSGHSFRISEATTAARQGVEDSTIKNAWALEELGIPTVHTDSKGTYGQHLKEASGTVTTGSSLISLVLCLPVIIVYNHALSLTFHACSMFIAQNRVATFGVPGELMWEWWL